MSRKLLSVKHILVISLIFLILPSVSHAEAWIDSLYVRVGNPVMDRTGGQAVLTFDIEVFRPVEKWNKDDYTLGRSDFTFGKPGLRMANVFSDLQVQPLCPEISLGVSKSLQLEGNFILDGLMVSLSPSSTTASPLVIPYREWVKLCQVTLTLANPTTVELGLLWDLESSGCITMGNIPMCETFQDDLDKIPDNFLTFVDYSSSQTVCPEEEVLLFAHAVSSSKDGLTCKWMQEVGGVWQEVLSTEAGQAGFESQWASLNGYQYQMKGKLKDTLILRGLTSSQSGITLKCVAQDLTLGDTPSENTRETPDMVLKVLPKVEVALEGYASLAEFKSHLGSSADTVFRCDGAEAPVRVGLYGLNSMDEVNALKNMGGKLYVEYKWEDNLGSTEINTMEVELANIGNSVATGNGQKVLSSESLELKFVQDGKYFIKSVRTDSCSAGVVLAAYDTVFVKSRSNVAYEFDAIDYVAGSAGIDVVTGTGLNSPELKLNASAIGVLYGDDYSCVKGKVGTDTLYYIFNDGGCTITATRLIHVLSSKSVAIKVLLEGPYLAKSDSMYCILEDRFPGTLTEYISNYPDHKICPKPFPQFDRRICDWIYVELWDYPPNGMTNSDTKRGNLIDATSALLLSDGTVADIQGNKFLTFDKLAEDEYYIVVKHRSHMSIMSARKIPFALGKDPAPANTIDFTESLENVFDIAGAKSQQTPLKEGKKLLMYAGEIVADGQIGVTDVKFILLRIGKGDDPYSAGDLNFDGEILSKDKSVCNANMSILKKY